VGVYQQVLDLRPGDLFFSASPFHHTAGVGMVLTALACGAGVALAPRFSADAWRAAGRLGISHALLVPTMIDMLLANGSLADTRPRLLQYGAAPMDSELLREALAALRDTSFVQVYGQTEVSPVTALTHDDHRAALAGCSARLSSVGRAVPDVELRVEGVGDDGIGELAVRAAHAFVVDQDGWRRTGDLARIDSEGYVTLHGRLKDRIIRGGENIYPVEVERALAVHPDVADVAVVGVPDRRWGEVVKAVVVPRDLANLPDESRLGRAAQVPTGHVRR
jgi:acyl-CoA synthetase (AMP-forming)/AMP-acid ligase II